MASIYGTLRWQLTRSRALSRDGNRCTVARLLGGDCSRGVLHVHHVVPVRDGGDPYDLDNVGTACRSHHAMWEPLRRMLVERLLRDRGEARVSCPHQHRTREARRLCEERLNRSRRRETAAA